jgi:hypothetical protein
LRICGTRRMKLTDLVRKVLSGDLIAARQWVADAQRQRFDWSSVTRPADLSDRELTVAAALVELLASRAGATPPVWAARVGPEPTPLVLDPGLEKMPRSFSRATTHGPDAFRKRNLVVLPDFLAVV